MILANFRTDRNGIPYFKKCKYHCDYSDGEYCHYKEEGGCIYNKGRKLTDSESMEMMLNDTQEIPEGVIPEVRHKFKGVIMERIKKVSIGLLCICHGTIKCIECPYANDNEWHDCRRNCAREALELLSEQQNQIEEILSHTENEKK